MKFADSLVYQNYTRKTTKQKLTKSEGKEKYFMGFNKTGIFLFLAPYSKTVGATNTKCRNLPLEVIKIISTFHNN